MMETPDAIRMQARRSLALAKRVIASPPAFAEDRRYRILRQAVAAAERRNAIVLARVAARMEAGATRAEAERAEGYFCVRARLAALLWNVP